MKCPQCQAEWEISPVKPPHPEIKIYVIGPSGSRKSTLVNMMESYLMHEFIFYGRKEKADTIQGPAEIIYARARE